METVNADYKINEHFDMEIDSISKRFFEGNATPILVIEPSDGSIISFNASALKFYGYDSVRFKTMKISDINVLTKEAIAEEMNFAISEQRNFFNFQHRLANNRICDVEVTSMPIAVNGKQYLYSMIVATDNRPTYSKHVKQIKAQLEDEIDSKMKDLSEAYENLEASYEEIMAAEQELQDQNEKLRMSESKYRGIFENIPGGILHFDLNGKITDLNDKFFELMGSDRTRLVGLNIFSLPNQSIKEAVSKCLKGEETYFRGVYRSETGNKTPYITAVFTPIKGVKGEVVAGQGLIFDITEVKHAEMTLIKQKETFEALFRNSPFAIVQFDENHRAVNINKAFSDLFGYKPEEAMGVEVDHLISDINSRNEVRTYSREILNGASVKIKGKRAGKNHREILADITGVPVLINGEVIGGFAIYHDITEMDENHRALIRAKEQAEAANEAKSNFLANMSHEIRTPMNGLIGTMQIMEMMGLDAEQLKYLGLAKISANALLHVVNDILDYTKIEMGRVELSKVTFNPLMTIREVEALFKLSALNKNIDLQVHFDDDLPIELMGDPLKLQQVLNNLVGNAIKFTHCGRVVIRITKELMVEHNIVMIRFEVEDTGIGISEERLEYIFERFSQVDATNTRRYGGTGLGLPISRGLVELMGGQLWVESQFGKGSKFIFTCQLEVFD